MIDMCIIPEWMNLEEVKPGPNQPIFYLPKGYVPPEECRGYPHPDDLCFGFYNQDDNNVVDYIELENVEFDFWYPVMRFVE